MKVYSRGNRHARPMKGEGLCCDDKEDSAEVDRINGGEDAEE
jgi:hypothetical protein